jgi:predicted ATPase
MRRYVLTGAPGAGKTSVLLELASRGYAVVPDRADAISTLILRDLRPTRR